MKRLRPLPLALLTLIALLAFQVYSSLRHARLNHELVAAVRRVDTPRVKLLLAQGADPNARDETGHVPPPWYKIVLDHLLHHKQPTKFLPGPTVVIIASHMNNYDLVDALLTGDADVNRRGASLENEGMSTTPLLEAAMSSWRTALDCYDSMSGPHNVLKLFLAHGADANAALINPAGQKGGYVGMTALDWVASGVTGYSESATKSLLCHGADVNHRFSDGDDETLLMRAVENDWWPHTIQFLLTKGAKVNEKSKSGKTALSLAVHPESRLVGQRRIIKLLKQAGAKE